MRLLKCFAVVLVLVSVSVFAQDVPVVPVVSELDGLRVQRTQLQDAFAQRIEIINQKLEEIKTLQEEIFQLQQENQDIKILYNRVDAVIQHEESKELTETDIE